VIDLVEAFLLKDRVGDVFPGTVVEVDRERDRGTVVIPEPAVSAKIQGSHLPYGEEVRVRLTTADVTKGVVSFELA
jgi:exoribonuclease R